MARDVSAQLHQVNVEGDTYDIFSSCIVLWGAICSLSLTSRIFGCLGSRISISNLH